MSDEQAEKEFLDITKDFVEVPNGIHYRRSSQIGKLVSALAKAQLEFGKVLKEAENEAFKRGGKASKYATLDSVVSATREALAKQELVIVALPDSLSQDGKLRLTSIMLHSSEQFIESTLTMSAVDKLTPHQVGALLTYGRRYQWYGLTGTAPSDDDDGNTASGVGSSAAAQAVAQEKIAGYKAKKDEKASSAGAVKVTSIFYTLPAKHNGNFAEFLNMNDFCISNPERADELRLVFSQYMSKQFAKSGAVIVSTDKLPKLLEILAGDMALTVEKLEANE